MYISYNMEAKFKLNLTKLKLGNDVYLVIYDTLSFYCIK